MLTDCKYPGCGGFLTREDEIRCFLCNHEHDENGELVPPVDPTPINKLYERRGSNPNSRKNLLLGRLPLEGRHYNKIKSRS